MEKNEPRIACLMCDFVFCQKEAQVPRNVNVARVSCIGRIDPVLILEMFEKGTEAVMLVGCKPPDCHYVDGNAQAEITISILKTLMSLVNVEPERLKLLWHSPTAKKSFSRHLTEFSDKMRKLASLSLKNINPDTDFLVNISAAKKVAADFRLRVLLGREKELTESVNVYGEKIPFEDFDKLLDEIVQTEFIRQKIHVLTSVKPLSVKALAEKIELKPAAVLSHIVNLRRKNMIAIDHVDGTTPFYKALEVK
ncbi:MAG: hydrogenase iron-sulfur subunit [Candidatus Bathyarchaeota archaeon]|nr:hydrogenase iron-sulfur subunit [Candidatus Bathyarchaeota archaeon]